MSTDFYARAISRYADASMQPVPPESGVGEAKQAAPSVKIDKYLALFTVKRTALAISYDPHALRALKKADLVSRTYGEGDNFRWDTLVAMMTMGDKKGAIVIEMTSDGRQGSSATVMGTLGMDAATLLAHLKEQGIQFPLQDASRRLAYEQLGLGDGYFADVSGSNGNLDTSKKASLTSSSVLTHLDNDIPGSIGLSDFKAKFDNDSFRAYDAESKKLFRINGKEDDVTTDLVKKILSQADEPAQTSGDQVGNNQTFQPQGLGQKGTDRFAEEVSGILDPKKVKELNNDLQETKKSLGEINEVVNGKSASDLRHMVSSLLIKVSKI